MMLSHQSTSFNKYSLNNRGCLASVTPSEDLKTTEDLGKTQTGVDSKFYNLATLANPLPPCAWYHRHLNRSENIWEMMIKFITWFQVYGSLRFPIHWLVLVVAAALVGVTFQILQLSEDPLLTCQMLNNSCFRKETAVRRWTLVLIFSKRESSWFPGSQGCQSPA